MSEVCITVDSGINEKGFETVEMPFKFFSFDCSDCSSPVCDSVFCIYSSIKVK